MANVASGKLHIDTERIPSPMSRRHGNGTSMDEDWSSLCKNSVCSVKHEEFAFRSGELFAS